VTERFEVARQIAASPSAVFAVTIDSSGMLQSAEGDPVTAVGDEFVVHMDRESLNDYPIPEAALRATLGILARTVE
jgi:hypothetical protein